MSALIDALDDEALTARVNEYWTVAGVLGHVAYWDIRFQTLAEKIDRTYAGDLLRLTVLAPEIPEATAEGWQPVEMTLPVLMKRLRWSGIVK